MFKHQVEGIKQGIKISEYMMYHNNKEKASVAYSRALGLSKKSKAYRKEKRLYMPYLRSSQQMRVTQMEMDKMINSVQVPEYEVKHFGQVDPSKKRVKLSKPRTKTANLRCQSDFMPHLNIVSTKRNSKPRVRYALQRSSLESG